MLKAFVRLGFLFLVTASWALGQQTSALVGTWAGKVQGYGVEMKLVLNADGTADFEGVAGRWRVQGTKLLLTQEGETSAYDFKLQGSQLTLSGGDLMAPLALSRAGSPAPASAVPSGPPLRPLRTRPSSSIPRAAPTTLPSPSTPATPCPL